MIHYIKIKNFYSFREEQDFSLLGTKVNQDDDRFMITPTRRILAKTAVILGANASGKTNFLKSFIFLNWFINSSWQNLAQDNQIPYQPFLFTNDISPTQFELCTESQDGTQYLYSLILTSENVIFESLKSRKIESKRYSTIFIRKKEDYKIYQSANFSFKIDIPQKLPRKNASFISATRQISITTFDNFLNSFSVIGNVNSFGRTVTDNYYFGRLGDDLDLRNKVVHAIKEFDTGISEFKISSKIIDEAEAVELFKKMNMPIQKNQQRELKQLDIQGIHSVDGENYSLDLDSESNGIRQLLPFLTIVFICLKNGGILIYDEIERGLHPLLIPKIMNLFYNIETNPRNAQLLCTCHSTDIINFLNKKQIFITDRNAKQESNIYKLSSMSGIRNDDNIESKYLSGTYGGIPSI